MECSNGSGKLMIPADAVQLTGEFKATVIECEAIHNQYLITLEINGNRLYALSKSFVNEQEISIDFDYKKIMLQVGQDEIHPMPEVNVLEGTFFEGKEESDNSLFPSH